MSSPLLHSSLRRRSALLLAFFGIAVFTAGVLVYLFARQPLPLLRSLHVGTDTFQPNRHLQYLIGSLPSFAHTYAFTVFIIVMLRSNRRQAVLICGSWLGLEILFELGQHEALSGLTARLFAIETTGNAILKAFGNYFMHGVFDTMDVLYCFIGTVAAFGTFFTLVQKGGGSCSKIIHD
jgi:hypothetical protein